MTIEVIAIGTELLSGYSVNTNAAYIGKELRKMGLEVCRQTVIPDDYTILIDTFRKALENNAVVIVTGGLGPTLDDITKDVAADLFESDFIYNEEIAADLLLRYGENLISLKSQATVPEKAIILKNLVGTAPGFILKKLKSLLILMPGVPKEMEEMMSTQVIPFLKNHFNNAFNFYDLKLHFYGLVESTVDPILRELKLKYPEMDFGIYPSLGFLSVVISSRLLEKNDARKKLSQASTELKNTFKDHFLPFQEKIEEVIYNQFKTKNKTLSLAESCTGGKISAKLVGVPGASDYFLGSIVCYSNFLKTKLLNVPQKLFESEGAVSQSVVSHMVLNLLEVTGSDYAMAVSGVAGPSGGNVEKPVGTIFGAIAIKGESTDRGQHTLKVYEIHLRGNREMIMESTVNRMLFELYKCIAS
jgi:nicotinamide-nucleotide amidase